MTALSYRFPRLTVSTPRLEIRPLEPGDAKGISEIFADRQTQRWLPFTAPVDEVAYQWCTTMADERRETGVGDHYAVVRHEDDELVGCLWARRTDWAARCTELWYAVAPGARGLGFATEATTALVMDLITEHEFERVELRIAPGNSDSRRVAEKAGFTYEGLLRNAGYVDGGRVDLEVWSLIAPDLRTSRP
ncbi:MAG: GNAT family N-acetyltransferase [Micromonosporaceae bacterium]